MNHILLLLAFPLVLLAPTAWAQNNFITLPNGDRFQKGIINLKIDPAYRAQCSDSAIAIHQLLVELNKWDLIGIEKKFPNTQPPAQTRNAQGQKLADLSLIYTIHINRNADVVAAAQHMAQLPWVIYAEPNFVSEPHYMPNDTELNNVMPYHYDKVKAYLAWDITLGDTNVVIGITETAIYNQHPDFVGNIKYNYDDPIGNGDEDGDSYIDNYAGWDVVDNDNDPFRNGEIHGDAVTGIAAATADNNLGYAGIGFNCKFIPVKVADNAGVITHGYEGIQYCVEQGCTIINCSWGNKTYSQVAQDVITWAAVNNDVVIVASAGNEDSEDLYYPASYQHVLSVTGVDPNDIFEQGTNTFSRNDSVDVSAPGINIYTTAYVSGVTYYTPPQGGTSMAAPIVSGIAALVRSQFPCFNAAQVIEKIKSSADPIDGLAENAPYAGLIGTGRVNAFAAVSGPLCNPVGINQPSPAASLTVYPNPSLREVNLRMSKTADWDVRVFDTQTRLIYSQTVQSDRAVLSNLPSGLYVVQVSNSTHHFSRKISIVGK